MKLCEKRLQILSSTENLLVTGGPGSGKTTIALLKALSQIEGGLNTGENILFLSFSRAAVARVLEASQRVLPKNQQSFLQIQTFHSFFWDILRTHGYLLGAAKKMKLILPHEERVLNNGIKTNSEDA